MPAGLPYFAWIDVSETTFGPEHVRWDESVFSFELKQDEGDPANMTIVVRRPRNTAGDPIGLLGPGRKIWAWFALDCGPALIKFRGRLVGIPTSMFEDLVTLEFVARPVDVVAQKEALADSLRVLPYYDEAMIDPQRRTDPEVVLEGYTKIWHYDRETLVITVSDEISGEDGLVDFLCANGDVFYDGIGLSLTSGPLARVDINAEFTWTQQASGTVDLTQYLISQWPKVFGGEIYLNAADWPKNKAGIGDGWEVAESHAQDLVDTQTYTETLGGGGITKFADGSTSEAQWSSSKTTLRHPRNVVHFDPSKKLVTNASSSVSHSKDGDGVDYVSSTSQSYSDSEAVIVVQAIKPTLVAGYRAERQCTEKVSLTLFADVQPILTDPEDGEALLINDIRSVNLSEIIDGQPPIIGNPARRSYIATDRGNRSIEHLIAYARAQLMKRARVVEIAFVPKLARMPEVTLRKNAFLAEPRVGEATGKIIGYSVALDGSDGQIKCEVKIGCTIGYGGSVAAADGTPTYCTIDYAGPDYQQFINRVVLFPLDTSVGYQPPLAAPNDDGINFLSGLKADDVIQVGLTVEYGPEPPGPADQDPPFNFSGPTSNNDKQNQLEARSEWIKNVALPPYETRAKFKLKSMMGEFSTNYELQVTDLMIPTGIDLEAV
jgi:hypothetical protein